MDIKAEVLYGKLIEFLGGDIDYEEVNYIIKLVLTYVYIYNSKNLYCIYLLYYTYFYIIIYIYFYKF